MVKNWKILWIVWGLLFLGFVLHSQDSLLIQQEIERLWNKSLPALGKPDDPKHDWQIVKEDIKKLQAYILLTKDTTKYLQLYSPLGLAHVQLQDYIGLKKVLEQAEEDKKSYQGSDNLEYVETALDYLWGKYYYGIGNYESSGNYYEQLVIKIEQGAEFGYRKMDVYNNLGNIYFYFGDYEKAIDYYQYSIEDSFQPRAMAMRYKNIAHAYSQAGQHKPTLFYYHKAIRTLEGTVAANLKSWIYNNLGKHHLQCNSLDSAAFYFNAAIALPASPKELLKNHKERAKVYQVQQKYDLALQDLAKAESIAQNLYATKKHPILGEINFIKGQIALTQQQPKLALTFFQKAIIALVEDFNDLDIKANPTLQNISSKLDLLDILNAKANVLAAIGEGTTAQATYQKAAELIDIIRLKDIQTASAKYQLLAKAKDIYEAAIQVALSQQDVATAFSFSQKGHGLLLSQAVMDKAALHFTGIPDSLLAEEQSLKEKIGGLVYQLQQNHLDTATANLLFETRLAYEQLLTQLEQTYPNYYQAKYTIPKATIAEIQDKLDEETALLEYFLGDSVIYTFLITTSQIEVFTHPKSPQFLKQVQDLQQSIAHFSTAAQSFQTYTSTAHLLYNSLLKQPVAALPSTIQQLIIIPDEELHYIPFAVLLSEQATQFKQARYDLLSFFIKDYIISYDYSSALFIEKYGRTFSKQLKSMIGFAPTFTGATSMLRDGETLTDLLHNKEEVTEIQKIAGGKIYLDTAATTQAFRREVSNYKIAHIASHATFSDSLPLSGIHFSDASLRPYEIYNLPLHLELVVLSACETGSGQLRKGEGMVSWAQAFLHAGCPSVVASLWKVNDNTTSQLMIDFYDYLFTGHAKSKAINLAQRQHLAQALSSFDAHPYYWAAFIQIGNTQPVQSQDNSLYWVFVGLVLLLFLFWVFRIKKVSFY